MSELVGFLEARITEDENLAAPDTRPFPPDPQGAAMRAVCAIYEARILAECAAKRAIIKAHEDWPVLVETRPEFDAPGFDPGDISSMTLRMTKQVQWMTEREYRNRFGTEPPTAPMLRHLAAVYADHPDYRQEWTP